MEAKSKLASRLRLWHALAAVALALATTSGCATAHKAQSRPGGQENPSESGAPGGPVRNGVVVSAQPMGPPEPFGPPAPEAPPVYGPDPVMIRPVVLVLGPGLARGYAHVGALRALSAAHIPVGAIVGTEMGALVGSLYAVDGNINHFEWALLKFKPDVFLRPQGLLTDLFKNSQLELQAKKLETGLNSVFGRRDLTDLKVPLRVAIGLQDSHASSVLDRGRASEAIRAAMAAPELYPPGSWNGVNAISAAETRPFAIAEARALNIGPVIVVDVLSAAEDEKLGAASELRDADLVIRPDMRGIGELDFQKHTDAAFRGKNATQERLPEIRHLVGLPPEDVPAATDLKTEPEGGNHP